MTSFVQLQHEANLERLRPLLEEELKNIAGGACSAEDPGEPTLDLTLTMTEASFDTNEWDCP